MLDRYTVIQDPSSAKGTNTDWTPQYNAQPTMVLPVQLSTTEVKYFNWGIMAKWANKKAMSPKLFNVPFNGIFTKASSKKAIMQRRCIILTDGFFLWKKIGKKKMTPYYFYLDSKELFGFAGIWEPSEDIDGKEASSFLVVTGHNKQLSSYHEDSPVVLERGEWDEWLDSNLSEEKLDHRYHESGNKTFNAHPVSPKNFELNANTPALVEVAMPSDQHGNYTLF